MPLLLGLLVTASGAQVVNTRPAPLTVAIVGLVHGHVEGFLSALPRQKGIELVGIAEPDLALQAKYEKKYALPHSLFFTGMEQMIEQRHPRAVLVYTTPAGHRKAIETAARYGVSAMVEKPLTIFARRRARDPPRRAANTTSMCWSTTKPPGMQAIAPPTTRRRRAGWARFAA